MLLRVIENYGAKQLTEALRAAKTKCNGYYRAWAIVLVSRLSLGIVNISQASLRRRIY
ncbi:hypothetical protein GCM10011502_30400 [Oceanisphaera marina]|uniref:Uncharacterized protein n=1 Tax=Oceanisphaera marina TaxID=2017550 RepID=A0ABQ1J082_9GAMM|nr:hypothetical protein GCM10011502_30400 [Oceanisphaera marina]